MKQVIDSQMKDNTSITKIHEMLVDIDKNIPKIAAFRNFMNKWDSVANENRLALLKDIASGTLVDVELMNLGIQKAMQLGNVIMAETIEEVKGIITRGEEIPDEKKKMIMKWYKDAGDLYIGEQTLKIKGAGQVVDQMALSILARAARAGKLELKDIGGNAEVIEAEPV